MYLLISSFFHKRTHPNGVVDDGLPKDEVEQVRVHGKLREDRQSRDRVGGGDEGAKGQALGKFQVGGLQGASNREAVQAEPDDERGEKRAHLFRSRARQTHRQPSKSGKESERDRREGEEEEGGKGVQL